VPVVTGEFDQEICAPSSFDEEYMSWADQHGVGYLAWGWWVLTPREIAAGGCSAFYLLTDYNGTPAAPNGTALQDHLLKLPPRGLGATPAAPAPSAAKKAPIKLTSFRARVKPGGGKVSFTLGSPVDCLGVLTGTTAKRFASTSAAAAATPRPKGDSRRRRVSLGRVRFSLQAGKRKTVVLTLSKRGAALLAAKRSLRASFTIALSGPNSARTELHRVLTLKLPAAKKATRKGR